MLPHSLSPLLKRLTPPIAALTVLSVAAAPGLAQTAEEKGFEIAARSDRSDRGFGDSVVKLTMVLRNAAGQETERMLKMPPGTSSVTVNS